MLTFLLLSIAQALAPAHSPRFDTAIRLEIAPSMNGDLPWRTIPIEAVQITDDDGSRMTPIQPPEIVQWVDFSNRVFAAARVRFTFDSDASDYTTIRSSILNRVMGPEDGDWKAAVRAGNAIAAHYPGKLTILFRWGQGEQPSGNGFSGCDFSFIVMSPFQTSRHCGHPHFDALAHEIGHYLGLPHTFIGEPFPDRAAAEAAFLRSEGKPAVFDGDGFSDTPPDPAIRTLECERVLHVELNGVAFPLPRRNIMSYYDERDSLSPQQIVRVRWMLEKRLERGMTMPTNAGIATPQEVEKLSIVDSRALQTTVQRMEGFGMLEWSDGGQLFCAGKVGSTVVLRASVPRPGRYRLDLYATQAPDYGILLATTGGKALGAPFDGYAPVIMPSGRIALGTIACANGMVELRFEIVGKNPASTNTQFGLDAITLTPVSP